MNKNGVKTLKLVQMEKVVFGYAHTPTLNGISLTIDDGEFVGIEGPNGASKSTLLKLMLGLLKPWSGKVTISKKNHNGKPLRVGYVPQQIASFNAGFPSTVIELVRSGRFESKKWYQKMTETDHLLVKNALMMVGMWGHRNKKIGDLSGGQKQKICIARALAAEADLLILDEPTIGMDVSSRKEFYQFLQHQVKQHHKTILMVTHQHDEMEEYFDKVIHLEEGEKGRWKCFTLNSCSEHSLLVDSLQS